MITGFNTDIVHGGVTYHVQTEDKGVETPLILSLVYDRGTILASKRTTYDDLIEAGFDEKVLAERLQKQHKLICAAVRAGRIDELKKMTAKDAAQKKESRANAKKTSESAPAESEIAETPAVVAPEILEIKAAPQPEPVVPVKQVTVPAVRETAPLVQSRVLQTSAKEPVATANTNGMPPAEALRATNLANLPPIGKPPETRIAPPQNRAAVPNTAPPPQPTIAEHPANELPVREARPTMPLTTELKVAATARDAFAPAIPQPKEPFVPAIPQPEEELVWDLPLQIIDETSIIAEPGDAEPIIAADAVEILTDSDVSPRSKAENLEIEFLNETNFRAGERKTLNIRVFRGRSENFISEAQVMVKVLGSSFRPLIFHARTNGQGVATVHLQLPQFRSGRGAILVRAISDGEEAELRQIVKQS